MQKNTNYAYKTTRKACKTHKYTIKMNKISGYVSAFKACGVRGGTTEKGLMFDRRLGGYFYRKQLLFSFKKRNKQSSYGTGMTGNKVKCDGGHTTVNVWI